MLTKTYSATLSGVDAKIIEVEVDVSNGLPAFAIVGLVDISIRESRERIRGCLRNSRYRYPLERITVNLAPADIYKYGTQFDLAIAAGILASSRQISLNNAAELKETLFLGEIAMDGSIRPVRGVLAMVIAAKERGFKKVFVPKDNLDEAAFAGGIRIYACEKLERIFAESLPPSFEGVKAAEKNFFNQKFEVDFGDVIGQESAKRGLEIAVSGGHNLLMTGPPGIGKTLLAQATASIIPEPEGEELLQIMKIQSAAGFELKTPIPFRNPHHTISSPAFAGGGSVPRPGEISLAHGGILFLDELPEFSREVLENLREPLEQGKIAISRASGKFIFPAEFILLAAQNPCPCGFFGDAQKACTCTPGQVVNYARKVSGAILDRIDLQIKMTRETISAGSHSSAELQSLSAKVKARIAAARRIQIFRQGKLNKSLARKEIERFCTPDQEGLQFLSSARQDSSFSLRSFFRILKVARTIADLAGRTRVGKEHVAEALAYKFTKV